MDTVVRLIPDHMFVRLISIEAIETAIAERARQAMDKVLSEAEAKALDLVPVRKVFKYGRTPGGLRIKGRQDVRTQSLEEALQESVDRQRLGLPSAFPTDAAGRRLPGSQPLVRTAQLTDEYRSRNRANAFAGGGDRARRAHDIRDRARREVTRIEARTDDRGRTFFVEGAPRLVDPQAQADLSAAGRRELARTEGDQLGGALRDSIHANFATPGRVMTATLTAGGEDAKYAKFVEFGTRHARAQPFMRPALAHARQQYVEVMKRALVSGKVGRV